MKKMIGASLIPVALLIASQAQAAKLYYSAEVCQPTQASLSCIEYTQFGVHNICSTSKTVDCPLPTRVPNSPDPFYLTSWTFSGYDRNSSSNVSCSLQLTDSGGNIIQSSTLATSGSGSGVVSKSATTDFNLVGYWRVTCSVPAVQSGALSHVTQFTLVTTD